MSISDLWINGTALANAIGAERPVLITYVAADGEQTTRTIEPYELAGTRGGNILVLAMDRRSGDARSFRLDRITHLSVLSGTFVLDRIATLAALARVRADIADVEPDGYAITAARWSPGDPIL
jgi:predicted DNA-binding transcriptional regulator YafY